MASDVTIISAGGGGEPSTSAMVSPAVGTARWNAVATLNQKALRFVVGGIERHPDWDQVRHRGQPGGKQRGLAEPRRGGDEGDLGVRGSTQPLRKPIPAHQGLAWARNEELRIGEGAGHASGCGSDRLDAAKAGQPARKFDPGVQAELVEHVGDMRLNGPL